jgi:hypothetical protein
LTGNSKEAATEQSNSSTFIEMVDAYRTMFIYGLIKGERLKSEKVFIAIGQFSMLMGSYDFSQLLQSMGKPEDLEDVGGAINEYTNWAIEDVRKNFPKGKLSIKNLKSLFD